MMVDIQTSEEYLVVPADVYNGYCDLLYDKEIIDYFSHDWMMMMMNCIYP